MNAAIAHRAEPRTLATPLASVSVSKSFVFNVSRIVLSTLFIAALGVVLQPELRASIRGSVIKDYRTVVSTVAGDLRGDGSSLTVVKVRTRDSLFLEIYDAQADGGQRLIEKIEMANAKDGYFNFNGQATNLAIDDIDGDGRPEILAPSFDSNLVGHLNIYRYDAGAQGFQRIMR